MTKKRILLITDLPIWSMANNAGARSFNETIQAFKKKYDLTIGSSARNLKSSNHQFWPHLNIHRFTKSKFAKFFIKPLFLNLNFLITFIYLIRNSYKFDIIYCYEIAHPFAASCALSIIGYKGILVTRFQGTILTPILNHTPLRKLYYAARHIDHILALKAKSDLIVMTDDGTKGDLVLSELKNKSRYLILKNGIDIYDFQKKYIDFSHARFISCSRLERWKRVDRVLDVFAEIAEACPEAHLDVVGDGSCKYELQQYSKALGLSKRVTFHGALSHRKAVEKMAESSYLISCFELSNVGNPLQEALALGLWVLTLSNGDTAKHIIDGYNGNITDEENYRALASRAIDLVKTNERRSVNNSNSWSWEERMSQEIDEIEALCKIK